MSSMWAQCSKRLLFDTGFRSLVGSNFLEGAPCCGHPVATNDHPLERATAQDSSLTGRELALVFQVSDDCHLPFYSSAIWWHWNKIVMTNWLRNCQVPQNRNAFQHVSPCHPFTWGSCSLTNCSLTMRNWTGTSTWSVFQCWLRKRNLATHTQQDLHCIKVRCFCVCSGMYVVSFIINQASPLQQTSTHSSLNMYIRYCNSSKLHWLTRKEESSWRRPHTTEVTWDTI